MGVFNWLDLILIVFLLAGMAVGYAQGFVRQLIGLAAMYVSLVLATQFFRALSQLVGSLLKQPPNTLTNALAFFAILFVAMGIVNFLALDAYKSTRIRVLPLLDHTLGLVLGVASMWILASVVVSVLIFAATTQNWPGAETARAVLRDGLETSSLALITATTLPMVVEAIRPWLPAGLPAVFDL